MNTKLTDIDNLLDVMADLGLGKTRNRNLERLKEGEIGCEVCGRPVDTSKASSLFCDVSGSTLYLGPDCAKKLQKAGYSW